MGLVELDAYARLPIPVVGAEGHELLLADGRRVLDLYGGHCVNTLGAGDPRLGEVVYAQWSALSFATNLIDHEPRERFLAAFERNVPAGDWCVFATNSGAEANENALKLALNATRRERVIAFTGAFHGRSAAAAAVSEGPSGFPGSPFEVVRAPWGDLDAVRAAAPDAAAVILEPIQSLAGVVDPPEGFLAGLREICDAHGVALVFDEVQTGNGRLGHPWASQAFDVLPDVFTTAKGAAGGLPVGLTVASAEIASRQPPGLFGSTFGGGPLALAAAAEVSDWIARPGSMQGVREASLALRKAAERGPVKSVRGAGLLLGFELQDGFDAKTVRDRLLEAGVLVGTSRDPRVLRASPPLNLPPSEARRLAEAFESVGVGT